MTIIYRTAGAWGSGQGTNLSAAQVDGNFFDLATRVTTIEGGGLNAPTISSFTIVGTNLFVNMSDSTVLGPYTLPTASWNFRGDWTPSTVYAVNDVVTANGSVYLVMFGHTSATTFDPNANDGGGHNYYGLLLTSPSNSLPTGGTTGQILAKSSDTDYAVQWNSSFVPAGGTAGQLLVKNSNVDYAYSWQNPSALPITVEQLSDVVVSSPVTGDILEWDGTEWVNVSGTVTQGSISRTIGGSSYNLIAGDAFAFLMFNWGSTVTITIPDNASVPFSIDTEITFCVDAIGTVVTITTMPGVTLNVPTGYLAQLLCQNAVATIKKIATDRWHLFGLLAPDA